MKTKTINAILCTKFDDFLASITDEAVRELVAKNTIITGGAIVSLLLGEKINDFDLYFRNKETVLAVARYYVAQFKKNPPKAFRDSKQEIAVFVVDGSREFISGDHAAPRKAAALGFGPDCQFYDAVDKELNDGRVRIVIKSSGVASPAGSDDYQYFETIANTADQAEQASAYIEAHTPSHAEAVERADEVEAPADEEGGAKYALSFMSSNAISLTHRVQLVVRFYGEPDEIHKNYDFAHCTSFWTSWERKLTLRPEAMEALLTKELRYIGSRYPLCSIIRTRKFLGRGWTINAGQYVKMGWQLAQLDLDDIRVLDDQLVGVDAAYFLQIVGMLRDAQAKRLADNPDSNPNAVDGTYLMTLIDRLF